MKKYNLITSLAWMAVGSLFLKGAISMGLGSLDEPGSGFFPFLMSVLLISFSSILFISSLKKGEGFKFALSERFWPGSYGRGKIVLIVISLVLYVVAFNYLGFVLTTFLFVFFILRFVETLKWVTVVFAAGLTTAGFYAIFEIWLLVNLPAGPLGF